MSSSDPTAVIESPEISLGKVRPFPWAGTVPLTRWRPLIPLLGFAFLFHGMVAVVLFQAGLPFCFVPQGQLQVAEVLLVLCAIVGPLGLLLMRLCQDMVRQIRGASPPPIADRLRDLFGLIRDMQVLIVIYMFVLIAYSNLKPAIPLINPTQYDGSIEALERALFGGILPSEWLVARSSPRALACWNGVYNLMLPFMFVSLTIALYFDGIRGGARLVLAYSIGLLLDVFATLLYPTYGPLFVHPDWFAGMENLPSGELATFLKLTVEQYAQSPGTIHACGGISAMPSYHVYAWICGFVYWRYLPRKVFALGLLLTALNWTSTIVLGWHYALDGLAGLVLALLVTWIVARIIPPAEHLRTR